MPAIGYPRVRDLEYVWGVLGRTDVLFFFQAEDGIRDVAVTGVQTCALPISLDLFEFPQIPGEGELLTRPSRNLLGAALSEERAAGLLRDKVLRVIFQQGFFKLRDPRIEITRVPCELHLPYWLGFYERSGSVRCRVMDAIRRRMEGAKASAFIEQWLAA